MQSIKNSPITVLFLKKIGVLQHHLKALSKSLESRDIKFKVSIIGVVIVIVGFSAFAINSIINDKNKKNARKLTPEIKAVLQKNASIQISPGLEKFLSVSPAIWALRKSLPELRPFMLRELSIKELLKQEDNIFHVEVIRRINTEKILIEDLEVLLSLIKKVKPEQRSPLLAELSIKKLLEQEDNLFHVEVIRRINTEKIPMKNLFSSTKGVIDYLSKNGEYLNYADFSGFSDFNDDDLESLLKRCPKIHFLNLKLTDIKNLNHLQLISKSLNIQECTQLDEDSLQHLEHVEGLQSLNISDCSQLAKDSLRYLYYAKRLQSLNIQECTQLDEDSLQHLEHVKELQSLNIQGCTQLAKDSLKHLEYVKKLQSLNIQGCSQLTTYSLQHLEYVGGLQSLNISDCSQLAKDSLKHLEYVKGLQSLNISACRQLNSLQYLGHVPLLQSLDIKYCNQLAPDSLQYLGRVPLLQSLDIEGCWILAEDSLKYLKDVPILKKLNFYRCNQLNKSLVPKKFIIF